MCRGLSNRLSVMDKGRDKHEPRGNSVNPPYHTSGAEKRQEMRAEGKKDVLVTHQCRVVTASLVLGSF